MHMLSRNGLVGGVGVRGGSGGGTGGPEPRSTQREPPETGLAASGGCGPGQHRITDLVRWLVVCPLRLHCRQAVCGSGRGVREVRQGPRQWLFCRGRVALGHGLGLTRGELAEWEESSPFPREERRPPPQGQGRVWVCPQVAGGTQAGGGAGYAGTFGYLVTDEFSPCSLGLPDPFPAGPPSED